MKDISRDSPGFAELYCRSSIRSVVLPFQVVIPSDPVETHADMRQALMEMDEEGAEEEKQISRHTPEKKKSRTRRKSRPRTKQKEKPFKIDRGRFNRDISGYISDKSADKSIDDRELD